MAAIVHTRAGSQVDSEVYRQSVTRINVTSGDIPSPSHLSAIEVPSFPLAREGSDKDMKTGLTMSRKCDSSDREVLQKEDIHTSVAPHQKRIDSSAALMCQLQIKSQTVEKSEYIYQGREWLGVVMLKGQCALMSKCWKEMQSPSMRLCDTIWSLCCLLGFFATHISLLASAMGPDNSTYLLVMSIVSVVGFLLASCTIIKLTFICRKMAESDPLVVFDLWLQLLYYGLCVYLASSLLLDGNSLGWVFVGSSASSLLLQLLFTSLWIVTALLAIPVALGELVVRFLACRLRCPQRVKDVANFRYGLYAFQRGEMEDSAKCSVCLADFTAQDRNLCVLLCNRNHIYHEDCIFQWLRVHCCCPVCRAPPVFKAD
jgi:hypothetical protein